MSQIEELIEKLCSNGVEWKTLGEVLKYEQPSKYIVDSTDYSNEGIPVLTAGASFILGYTNESDGIYKASKDNPVVIFDDFTTSFHWVDFDFKVKSSAMKMLKPINKEVNFRYVYYSMCIINYAPTEHTRQWIGIYSNFTIPLPPLEIQTRIVEILDHFTNLTANLTAELNLRRKQFEHYREKLLSLDGVDGVEWKTLGEVSLDCYSGATPSTKRNDYWENGTIPWMSSGEVNKKIIYSVDGRITEAGYKSCSTKMVPIDSIVIALAGQGKTRGLAAYTQMELCTNQSLCAILPNKDITVAKYIYYYLDSQYQHLRQVSSGDGTRGGLNLQMIRSFSIPVPPLAVQQSIVKKLDTFTALIENIEQELDLRQKQYEYYREQLLNF